MASNISIGKGDSLTASTSAAVEYLVPNPTNGGGNNDFGDCLRIWNEGSVDVRVQINVETAAFTVATAMVIPAGKDHYVMNWKNPIKKFCYATESSEATIKYAAN